MFESLRGKKIYSEILRCIDDFNMGAMLEAGAVLGLSGGADSVLLLIFLRKFRKSHNFNLKAVHINHMIRGASADRDEDFSRKLSELLEIDFESRSYDVPAIAKEQKTGMEEAARGVRYRAFNEYTKDGYPTVVTAHNATDNLETFMFNFMRGTGISGLTAISPVRDNIVRPLLYVPKEDIVALLDESNIPYCTDETNSSEEYTRNYIRHEILPLLKRLSPSPENSATRAIANLRCDDEFIDSCAKDFFESSFTDVGIELASLRELHKSVFTRVIRLMVSQLTVAMPERVHFDALYEAVHNKNVFEIDLPGNVSFISNGRYCYARERGTDTEWQDICVPLKNGFNEIPELGIAIGISRGECEDFSSNVYNFSMKASLSSAIIVGELHLRTKRDGDAYRYGDHTRKLKKLFNDKKIPLDERNKIPVVCDSQGIVWVMGFGVRDDEPTDKTKLWLTVYKKST